MLSLDGLPLGTLCIIDSHPHPFPQDKLADLHDFAAVVEEYLQSIERHVYTENLKSDLQRTEALFEQTFSQAAVGMALVSLQGYWLRVNPRICEMLQYSERELMDRTFQDITYPLDLNTDLEYLQQLLKNEISTYSMEKRYFRADGSIVWVQLTVALNRLPNGKPDHFISVIVDISERKAAEADLFACSMSWKSASKSARMSSTWWLKAQRRDRNPGTRRISAQRGERTPARHYRQHAGVNQPDRRQ